ncbi:MAG: protein phosphatase 2C domain-containing protein [Candidatus Shapirobacteria bacterium]|nr:protein phosphatase 2C domain-containing protein [Candidatus Shapirobacteria bacterium]
MENFELAGGTIIGKDHHRNKFNNQDAYHIEQDHDIIVAFICDGCGDKATSGFSEVGANIGCRLLTTATMRMAKQFPDYPIFLRENSFFFWEQVRNEVLATIRYLCRQMGEEISESVIKYFLFTTIGVLITPQWAQFVSIGDGVIIVNGQELSIGPFPDNMPPYLGYTLVQSSIDPELLKFQSQYSIPTSDLDSFLIGCDGVIDLIAADNLAVPTTKEVVGPISQFWQNDQFFGNPLAITRQLAVINRDRQTLDHERGRICPQYGLLRDDTTLVVGRKRKEEE